MVIDFMKPAFTKYKEGKYRCFISDLGGDRITSQAFVGLVEDLKKTARNRDGVRTGRGCFKLYSIGEGLDVLMRGFLRGGWMGHVNSDVFFGFGTAYEKMRPVMEMKNAARLFEAGVSVPRVFGAVVEPLCHGVWYRGYICYEAVSEAANLLASIVEIKLEDLKRISWEVGQEARKMLEVGVMHRDLHIGNVLLNKAGKVVLIDFDKSFVIDGADKEYCDKLVVRWARSVKKHGLPQEMVEDFKTGLIG